MEPKVSTQVSKTQIPPTKPTKDFLNHLEIYLAKRDGVDKLLKISRYATKIILASSIIADTKNPLIDLDRLKSFESSVGISRKAFRLGKFVQDVNALRTASFNSGYDLDLILLLIAYGGEGLYFFIEQFVWLGKAGLIDKSYLNRLQKMSAWCEFIGYFGSVSLKVRELRKLSEDERCLMASIELAELRRISCEEEMVNLRKLREKKFMKKLSTIQDLADGLMALADIRDGKGKLSAPMLVSSAGLLSAIISTHKNWIAC